MQPGSAVIPPVVVQAAPQLSGAAVRLALALGKFMNGQGECWPAYRTLMGVAGIRDQRTFSRARRELADRCGLVWFGGRPGRGHAQHYRFADRPAQAPTGRAAADAKRVERPRQKAGATPPRTSPSEQPRKLSPLSPPSPVARCAPPGRPHPPRQEGEISIPGKTATAALENGWELPWLRRAMRRAGVRRRADELALSMARVPPKVALAAVLDVLKGREPARNPPALVRYRLERFRSDPTFIPSDAHLLAAARLLAAWQRAEQAA